MELLGSFRVLIYKVSETTSDISRQVAKKPLGRRTGYIVKYKWIFNLNGQKIEPSLYALVWGMTNDSTQMQNIT